MKNQMIQNSKEIMNKAVKTQAIEHDRIKETLEYALQSKEKQLTKLKEKLQD